MFIVFGIYVCLQFTFQIEFVITQVTNIKEDVAEVHLLNKNKTDDTNKGGISSALTWVHNHHGLAK